MEVESQSELRYWKPFQRRFDPDSPFFVSGNVEREILAKQVALDLTEDEKLQLHNMVVDASSEIFCPIVGYGAHLKSLDDFEDHYNSRHTASCSVCLGVYPTSRLLSLHVSEAHDSFFQAKVVRGYDMIPRDYCRSLFVLYWLRLLRIPMRASSFLLHLLLLLHPIMRLVVLTF